MKDNTFTPECCADCQQDRNSRKCTEAPTRCREWQAWFHEHWTRIRKSTGKHPNKKEEKT